MGSLVRPEISTVVLHGEPVRQASPAAMVVGATGFVLADLDFQLVSANRAALQILSYPCGLRGVSAIAVVQKRMRSIFTAARFTADLQATTFLSGRRHYVCRPFLMESAERPAMAALMLERHDSAQSHSGRAPRSVAERWALKVLMGCEADGDVRTLAVWASVAGLSYSSLCETCRLVGIQPLAARDLTRVLRAVMQSRIHGCRIGELLDICDRRTLDALMTRAAMDPRREGRDITAGQFLTAQRFVPAGNAGLAILRGLLPA